MKSAVNYIATVIACTLVCAVPSFAQVQAAAKPDDATIRKLLPGTWTNSAKAVPAKGQSADGVAKLQGNLAVEMNQTFKADGTFAVRMKVELAGTFNMSGTWTVKDGVIVMKLTASDNPGAPVGTELKEPVSSITEKEKVSRGLDGQPFRTQRAA
jgi:hypothetical protein